MEWLLFQYEELDSDEKGNNTMKRNNLYLHVNFVHQSFWQSGIFKQCRPWSDCSLRIPSLCLFAQANLFEALMYKILGHLLYFLYA